MRGNVLSKIPFKCFSLIWSHFIYFYYKVTYMSIGPGVLILYSHIYLIHSVTIIIIIIIIIIIMFTYLLTNLCFQCYKCILPEIILRITCYICLTVVYIFSTLAVTVVTISVQNVAIKKFLNLCLVQQVSKWFLKIFLTRRNVLNIFINGIVLYCWYK